MIRFALRAAFAAFLLVAVHGQAALPIFPPGPTSDDEVTLRVSESCTVFGHTVTRNGFEIDVRMRYSTPCPSPPIEFAHEVPLGELPPGRYRVTVTPENYQTDTRTTSFYVRNAEPVPFTLRPWLVPASDPQGAIVRVVPSLSSVDFALCCSSLRVEVGERVYEWTELARANFGFVPPPRPAGPVDVRGRWLDETFTIPAGLVYFDPGAPFDPSLFERVLFPVFFKSDGAHGSRWRSEAVISNPNSWPVYNLNALDPLVCTGPCVDRLAPKSRTEVSGQGFPQGVALLVPRGEADDLAFSLRIRDISRDEESYGVEVPVVRERDMVRNDDVRLLDVPLDPRFRTKVRIYAFPDPAPDGSSLNALYTAVHVQRQTPEAKSYPMASGCPRCAHIPYYREVDLAPGAAGERADVYIRASEGALVWAFASVTNNTTQQVTIVAPDGK